MALFISLKDHYHYTLLKIEGDVDAITAQMLDRAIEAATCEGNRHLILDCSHLYSISSEGLKVLLTAYKSLNLFHTMTLCSVSRSVYSLMKLCGVSRYIAIADSLDDAETMLFELDASIRQLKAG